MRRKKTEEQLTPQVLEQIKVKKYILTYIQELKRHFDISEEMMNKIIYDIYKDNKPINSFLNVIKNFFNMLIFKSKNIKFLRK